MLAHRRSTLVESLESRRLLSAAVVAFFDNSSYVDTSTAEPAATAANLQQELVQLGYTVKPFTGIDPTSVQQALQGANVVVIPPLVNGDLDSAMSNGAKNEIQSFLTNGGGLIVSGDPQDRNTNFLTDTFALPTLPAENGLGSTGLPEYTLNASAAAGTAFATSAATISRPDNLRNIASSAMPAGSDSIYVGGYFGANAIAVAMFPYAGKLPIIYLSYDWYNGGPNGALDGGWNNVLEESVSQLTTSPTTITTLVASPTAVVAGASVQLTATVRPTTGGVIPTGTVTFENDGSSLGTATLSNGTAILSTSALPVGIGSITAVYGGNTTFLTSTSPAVTVTVTSDHPLASATTLRSSTQTLAANASVTLTATVAPANGTGSIPTGMIEFMDGSTGIGSATLQSNGTATLTTTLPSGIDHITASYGGDTTYAGSASAAVDEQVGKVAPMVTLASSASSIGVGASVTLTATVAPAVAGGAVPTGTVNFIENGNIIGSGMLSGGTVSLSTSSLALGTDTVVASYHGDLNYLSATSAALTEHVNSHGTVTTLSSVGFIAAGAPITITAMVAEAGAGGAGPTGTVTFFDGNTTLSTDQLGSDGTATCTTTLQTPGSHPITASYSGDSGNAASVSGTDDVQVSTIPSTTTLTASASSIGACDSVAFTATVSSSASGGTTPTGTVDFIDNGADLGSASLQSDGAAVLSTSVLLTGNNSVTANYRGDTNYSLSSSTPVAVTVAAPISKAIPGLGKIVLPPSAIAGGTFVGRFPVVISNSGSTLTGLFTIQVFISPASTLDTGAISLSSVQKNLNLADGGSKSITAVVKSLPATLPDGSYYLLTEVTDPTGAMNVSASATTIEVAAPSISLHASVGAVKPSTIAIGKSGSILVTITNDGNEIARGLLHLSLDPSADGQTPLSGETLATVARQITLKPGKSHTYRLRLKIPAAATTGAFYPFLTASLAGITGTAIGTVSFTIS